MDKTEKAEKLISMYEALLLKVILVGRIIPENRSLKIRELWSERLTNESHFEQSLNQFDELMREFTAELEMEENLDEVLMLSSKYGFAIPAEETAVRNAGEELKHLLLHP